MFDDGQISLTKLYLPVKTRVVAPSKVQEKGREALRVTPRSASGMSRLVPCQVSVSDMFGKSGQRIMFKSCLLRPKVKGPSGFQVLLMPCSLLEMFEAVAGV